MIQVIILWCLFLADIIAVAFYCVDARRRYIYQTLNPIFQAKLCHKGGTGHIRPVEILPSAPDSGTSACVNHIPDSLKICLTRFPVCKITRTEHSAQPFKFPPLFPVPSHCQNPVFLCKAPYQVFSQKSGCTCYKNCIFSGFHGISHTLFPLLSVYFSRPFHLFSSNNCSAASMCTAHISVLSPSSHWSFSFIAAMASPYKSNLSLSIRPNPKASN